jgi:hypothetical protein
MKSIKSKDTTMNANMISSMSKYGTIHDMIARAMATTVVFKIIRSIFNNTKTVFL